MPEQAQPARPIAPSSPTRRRPTPHQKVRTTMNTLTHTRTRAAATTLAVLAALTVTISGPAAADAKVHGSQTVQVAKIKGLGEDVLVTAMYKPGPPPVWCGIVRFCPYETGA